MRTERLCRCLYLSFGKTMPFIVDAKASGVTIGKNERRLGLNGTPNAPVYLENVKVPVENRVGEEGDGFKIAMSALDSGRYSVAAGAVGVAQACGIADTSTLETMAEIEAFASSLRDVSAGPRFASVKIDAANLERVLSNRDGTFVLNRLRGSLGFSPI